MKIYIFNYVNAAGFNCCFALQNAFVYFFVCFLEEGAGCVGVQLQLSGSGPPQSVQSLLGSPV